MHMLGYYFIGLSKIKTVDSAQPRNCSIVTRPFSSWEGGDWAWDYWTSRGSEEVRQGQKVINEMITCLYNATQGAAKLHLRRPKTELYRRSFKYMDAKLYNELPGNRL